ncbi:hypothetical protein D9758_009162 [Tetrapyrgos nigripes]|uniref:F-box domain-containing protein n=1 Tax=Tetrapyrgos nigripes TaxID=182062 RepID=A0A8H5LK95_9AGAR|nr:hypothetical protein D9758_009162 [Tetrapyrgos nigripes]
MSPDSVTSEGNKTHADVASPAAHQPPPELIQYLRSNTYPSDDAPYITRHDKLTRAHDICNFKFQELQAQLELLEKERAMLGSWRSQHARRTPPELLTTVFHYLDLTLSIAPMGDGKTAIKAETLASLAHVCTYWCQHVNSCPELWSSMALQLDQLDDTSAPLVRPYLDRSRAAPLTLKLRDNLQCIPYPTETVYWRAELAEMPSDPTLVREFRVREFGPITNYTGSQRRFSVLSSKKHIVESA